MTEQSPNYDCLCVGIIVADHVCDPIDHFPAAGELVTTARLQMATGGCAANVAVDLAKLNASAAVIGRVGQDIFGRFVRESLAADGVICDHIVESPDQQTSGTLVVNVKGEDRRFVHAIGANAEFTCDELPLTLLQATRVLYFGGYCLAAFPTAERVAGLFKAAQAAGVTTVLDVVIPAEQEYWSRLKPVLPYTDVFLPNNDEACVITGLTDPVQQADAFHDAGARTVVVTCGRDGAILVSDKTRLRAGKYNVDFVDGTGSGDAFVAGYIYGLLQGAETADCLRFGSALGASCVRSTGATAGVLRANELRQFVQNEQISIESL